MGNKLLAESIKIKELTNRISNPALSNKERVNAQNELNVLLNQTHAKAQASVEKQQKKLAVQENKFNQKSNQLNTQVDAFMSRLSNTPHSSAVSKSEVDRMVSDMKAQVALEERMRRLKSPIQHTTVTDNDLSERMQKLRGNTAAATLMNKLDNAKKPEEKAFIIEQMKALQRLQKSQQTKATPSSRTTVPAISNPQSSQSRTNSSTRKILSATNNTTGSKNPPSTTSKSSVSSNSNKSRLDALKARQLKQQEAIKRNLKTLQHRVEKVKETMAAVKSVTPTLRRGR